MEEIIEETKFDFYQLGTIYVWNKPTDNIEIVMILTSLCQIYYLT